MQILLENLVKAFRSVQLLAEASSPPPALPIAARCGHPTDAIYVYLDFMTLRIKGDPLSRKTIRVREPRHSPRPPASSVAAAPDGGFDRLFIIAIQYSAVPALRNASQKDNACKLADHYDSFVLFDQSYTLR